MTMTVSTNTPSGRLMDARRVRRLLMALLCLVALGLLFTSYAQGVHRRSDEAVNFTGIDFLLGRPEGRSAGSPHPMLLGSTVALVLALVMLIVKPDKRFWPVLLLLVASGCLLMFRFDVCYSAKNEFSMDEDSLSFGVGWILSVGSCFLAAVLAAVDAAVGARQARHKQLETIYANTTLPGGYKERTLKEIIVRDFKKHWPVYLMILPTVIFYLVWCYGPMYGIVIAFNDYSPKKGPFGSDWVGLRWFREFFRSPFAYRTIRNTLVINFWNLLIGFPAPIILALMLNEMRNMKFKRVVQTITYMPYFISLVVLCGILVDFCSTDGVFGAIQRAMGMDPVNLLGDARYFRSVYVGSELWQKLGWDSIIFLSALAGIDQEQYEAATIDGAGKMKQVIHVTLPGIMPTIAILLILRVGSMMNVGYEKIILLYNGLTYETADVISSYVYRKGIVDADFSFSTAVNLFNSVINFALVVFANKVSAVLTETSLW